MSIESEYYLSPKYVGERFKNHAIPLVLLREIAVFQDLISETARWHYYNDNPDRSRLPSGFADWARLELSHVGEGSAVAQIKLRVSDEIPNHADLQYYEKAKSSVLKALSAASAEAANDETIRGHLPPHLLSFFDRIGRGLLSDERIEFASSGQAANSKTAATLDEKTRKRLTRAAKMHEYTKELVVRGSVSQLKQDIGLFKVDLIAGTSVEAPVTPEYLDKIVEALQTYTESDKKRVLVKGVARFDLNDQLKRFDSIDGVEILDTLDVGARLDEFRNLRNGWLDGSGTMYKNRDLDRLSNLFKLYYSNQLPNPYLFPTEDGDVLAEWQTDRHNVTLEIALSTFESALDVYERGGDDEQEDAFDLSGSAGWVLLNKRLQQFIG